jgi:lipopolysaccharide export system protein LptA
MWTPRRILLLGVSFLLILGGFIGYGATSVGRIDGMPPLPAIYWPTGEGQSTEVAQPAESELEKRLKLAFGNECEEVRRAIQLDMASRGMLLAAETCEIMDGKVKLTPISIAVLSKGQSNPEISTIRGRVGLLTFDRPVSNLAEISGRKLTEAELTGQIQIVNNRRRAEQDQDLRIYINLGPLYYNEETHRIWTTDNVKAVDFKARPQPHVINARGMEMELSTEPAAPPGKGGGARGRDTITGVSWLELKSSVVMDLYLEGKGGFFDTKASPLGGKPAEAPPPAAKGGSGLAPYSHVRVQTPGKFRYDLLKDHDLITFESPPRGSRTSSPPQVYVERRTFHPSGLDTLTCTRLEMRLKKRSSKAASRGGSADGEGVQAESIRATGPDGEVVLTSNAEKLDARGADFFHDVEKGLTILKGPSGVIVNRAGSSLTGKDLEMARRPMGKPAPGQPPPREAYDVRSKGPGRLEFKDPKDGRVMKARWANLMTVARDGPEDLITLLGDAELNDLAGKQELKADILKVWLDPEEPDKAQPARGAQADGSGRKPRHVEANGSVVVRSKDLNIHDTARLVLWFKDVPAPAALPGAASPPPAPKGGAPVPPPPVAVPGQKDGPSRPFDLRARSVEAKVLRSPLRNTIDVLTCEGKVVVRQDPAKPNEKGTLVKGETLRMTAAGEGAHVLVVTGDLAELHSDRMLVLGPEVTIDQQANKAWVIGDGAMRMDSATNFQGEKLPEPVPLVIHWHKHMLFNGSFAEFQGNIVATQGQASLACQNMTTYFDRVISLKQGNRADQPAKIRYMVCDKEVRVEETAEKAGKVVKKQRLYADSLNVTALEPEEAPGKGAPPARSNGNAAIAKGPGTFQVIDAGSGPLDVGVPGKGAAAPAKEGQALRMTHVAFRERMDANNVAGMARFWGDVRVLHIPVESFSDEVDLDKVLAQELPEKAMYMKCRRLKVLDRPTDGKPNKQMQADGQVTVLGRDFSAAADSVTYNQAKDQIIFTGSETGPAQLKKFNRPGDPGETVTARKIIYWRQSRRIVAEDTENVKGSSAPK